MSRPNEQSVPVRAHKREFEDRVLVRAAYTGPQPSDFITVVETVILRDRAGQAQTPGSLPAGRCLLLKLHNGTDGPVDALTLRVEQLDRRGGSLTVTDHAVGGLSAGAGEDFVPDTLLLLDKACTDVRVEVLTADSQGCRWVRTEGQTVLTYPEPAPDTDAPAEAVTSVYGQTARIAVGVWPGVIAVLLLAVFTLLTVWGDTAVTFLYERVLEPVLAFFRSLVP